jgi:hypothetical protein
VTLPTGEAALEAWLRDQAADPWDFLVAEPTPVIERRVWPLASRLLIDGEARIRLRALEFFMRWTTGADRTLPRLADIAARHSALFADQLVDGFRLRERLQHVIADGCRPGVPLTATLWRLVDDRLPAAAAAVPLAAHDPRRAAQIAAQFPDALTWRRDVVAAIARYRRDNLLEILALFAGAPDAEALAAEADTAIDRDDRRARSTAQRHRLHPPINAPPSLRAIRHILGLPLA